MSFHVVDNNTPKPNNKKPLKHRNPLKKRKKWFKRLAIGTGALAVGFLIVLGAYKGYEAWNVHQIEAQVSINQKVDAKQSPKVATAANKFANKDISFDQNADIPDAQSLQKYRSLPEKLSFDGYISVPRQAGVSTPIQTLQINEGVSNKVLAYGAGTLKPNQVMGAKDHNYAIAAHNVGYGGGKLMFSPMQNGINVNVQPKAYLTDGRNIYVYQFNKESDSLSGRKVISYRNGGGVASDDVAKNQSVITLVTCNEDGTWTNNPEKRIVMTAHLIEQVNKYDASDFEKSLFPQIF
ncbi:sortase [Weissella oryzae SG25]|uniref:Sortase n=1 Tax=Weissella oryzae (strain DSM 25784 / JCM 18191 / LMG 30913 / SG25) TaxID=1329250 RepID=A0A069CWD3_WEIOS|nr:sortase [Weissella oryzae]GAK31538.1 sortase [Weissella oryzae SG25]